MSYTKKEDWIMDDLIHKSNENRRTIKIDEEKEEDGIQ